MRRTSVRTSVRHRTSVRTPCATLSPVTGCTKISLGCKFCYAERMAVRLQAMGRIAADRARKRAAEEQVKRELRAFEREMGALDGPFLHRRKRSAEAGASDGSSR